jgi:hypothetical protein
MGIIGEAKNKSIWSKMPNYDGKPLKIEFESLKERCKEVLSSPLSWGIARGHLLKGSESNRFTTAVNRIKPHKSSSTNTSAIQ